jgi:two-component sensor histidine kinase
VVPGGPAEIQAVASQFNRMVVAQHNSLASLAESEARWQFALEGSGDGVWDWNIVTGQVFYSARCNQILGFAEGGLVGTIAEWTARTHPDDYDSVAALGRLHLDRKADSYAAGFRVRCKNNAYKWIYARGLVVERGPDGLALRMVGTITDISRTKQQDDDMRTAAIAFESQMPLYILNPECRFERTNRAFTVLTGLALPALQGQALDALLTRQSVEPEAVIGFWKGVVQNGEAQLEFAAQAGSGALLRLQTHLSVVKNDKAEVVAYVGTLVDITESRRLEAQRNAMLEAQKTALVREVHHRVKNNLQGMIGMLRAFGRNHPETMEPLSEVIGQVQSISVIHGLQGQTSLAQVRLCELTESIAHSIATARGADIRFHRPVPWRAHIIAAREAVPIALVLNELILNAVKHGRADQGPVQVSMEEGAQAGAVRVRISNHGSWKPEGKSSQVGLQLVETLLPHQGATLSRVLGPDRIDTLVELEPPVISPAQPDLPT